MMPKYTQFEFNRETDYSSENMQKIYEEMKKAVDFFPSEKSMYHLQNQMIKMLSLKVTDEWRRQYNLLGKIMIEMRERMIVDEVHSPLEIKAPNSYEIKCEIKFSNHDADFIDRYERLIGSSGRKLITDRPSQKSSQHSKDTSSDISDDNQNNAGEESSQKPKI